MDRAANQPNAGVVMPAAPQHHVVMPQGHASVDPAHATAMAPQQVAVAGGQSNATYYTTTATAGGSSYHNLQLGIAHLPAHPSAYSSNLVAPAHAGHQMAAMPQGATSATRQLHQPAQCSSAQQGGAIGVCGAPPGAGCMLAGGQYAHPPSTLPTSPPPFRAPFFVQHMT